MRPFFEVTWNGHHATDNYNDVLPSSSEERAVVPLDALQSALHSIAHGVGAHAA